jgi:phage gp29-like protein
MKKLWLNERGYVLFSEAKLNFASEVATRKRSIDFYSMLKYLPDPDPVLRKQGKDVKIYRDMLIDPHVWACVQSRKSGVLSLEWEIDRGKAKSKQADIIENLFNNLDLNTIISEILDCVLFGFQPLEVMWKQDGNLILPYDIVGKPPEWFVFDDENRLMLKTKDNPYGEELSGKKFLCPQYNPSYLNPYGERTLARIFWNITFKKGGIKFWSLFTEKYGMPFLELKESVKNSSADVYERLVDKMNAEISKAILGQTLTTEIGNTGSYAAANTHMGVRQDIIKSDKRIVERTLNQLIRWIYEFNFSEQVNIPTFSMWEEEDVDLNIAQRDKILVDSGVKFTKKYLMKTYGFDEEDIDVSEKSMPDKIQPAFKGVVDCSQRLEGGLCPTVMPFNASNQEKESEFPDQQTIDKFIDSFSDDELQAQAETILKPIFQLINSANSYEEIYEKLSEKGLRTAEIEKILQKVIFVSETWGRINGLD